MTNDKSKMLKVVYFDENSAIDYLDVWVYVKIPDMMIR